MNDFCSRSKYNQRGEWKKGPNPFLWNGCAGRITWLNNPLPLPYYFQKEKLKKAAVHSLNYSPSCLAYTPFFLPWNYLLLKCIVCADEIMTPPLLIMAEMNYFFPFSSPGSICWMMATAISIPCRNNQDCELSGLFLSLLHYFFKRRYFFFQLQQAMVRRNYKPLFFYFKKISQMGVECLQCCWSHAFPFPDKETGLPICDN